MKPTTLQELIECLWNAGCRGPFSTEKLLQRLLEDGGHDTEDLTPGIIADLLAEKRPDCWSVATFAFSEIISFYLVTAYQMSFQQVVAAAFSACVIADASRVQECDWSMQHEKIMALCAILAGRLELDKYLYLMAYIYGKGGQPPISE